ncbi:hypothetical protein AR158_c147R [Paramecium bursaria Chlorella virus AR158]|uniref:hypothetical protein n=1 Tax=Paramecium bursaria Chlorella virus AR158 TaxID=380598 RepID=UPI00015AA7F2|nr:hypothetical protein AR158_c147R [Paramecium bursaria Chlorella virus AR158]ABU43693.1 hypothetical protein AR158_c147R [Paramecium bursaria Chlorella virus AR158]
MITTSNVFVSENICIFKSSFLFRPWWSIVRDFEDSLHRSVQLHPFCGRFAHLKVTHETRINVRCVSDVNFIILKK